MILAVYLIVGLVCCLMVLYDDSRKLKLITLHDVFDAVVIGGLLWPLVLCVTLSQYNPVLWRKKNVS